MEHSNRYDRTKILMQKCHRYDNPVKNDGLLKLKKIGLLLALNEAVRI